MIGVTILGATGSIGVSTLDVIRMHPDKYRVVALTANRNVDLLLEQCLEFKPDFAVMADDNSASTLRQKLAMENLKEKPEVLSGVGALEDVASLPQIDYVMAAIVGAAGLLPSLAAARGGKRVLLANKEALVMAGPLFTREVEKAGAQLLPIDSEHNAIFQCLPTNFSGNLHSAGIRRILLTASGGPFRNASLDELERVTPAQACAHPNWVMGRKISVDSATMMNKGLELIEACWLFNTEPKNIQIVVHPQSVVHSMVEYTDGSVLAQLGNPDMRTPIAHAMAWPKRMESGVASLDMFDIARLDFEAPDTTRFPALRLSVEAMQSGGAAPAILNAANEVAVDAFLNLELSFVRIAAVIEEVLNKQATPSGADLDCILEADRAARVLALAAVRQFAAKK